MNNQTKALFDVSVLIDALDQDKNLKTRSAEALNLAALGKIDGYLCAASVDALNDLLTRTHGTSAARATLRRLCGTLSIAKVDAEIIKQALAMSWAYLEDAVIHECARIHGFDQIITLNPDDYAGTALPVWLPAQLVEASIPLKTRNTVG